MIDHVPFAWHDLDEITAEFTRLGLEPVYGGEHDNGYTHMAIIGFDDHSYVELISEKERGEHSFWPAHIRASAGPADWCIRVEEIDRECVKVIDRGVPVDGPRYGSRERADGTTVEWDQAFIGDDSQRRKLPFIIADRTPLRLRVTPSPSVSDGIFSGLEAVVIAVEELEQTVKLFRDLYRYPTPVNGNVPGLGRIATFPGRPVTLVDSTGAEEWIAERLERIGVGPCACFLGTDSMSAVVDRYPVTDSFEWPGGQVAFFRSELFDQQLGVVDYDGSTGAQ
jgi:hypothetical protein